LYFQYFRKFDYKQFISVNYDKELAAFAHRLGLAPDNSLLRQALTHRSFLNENDSVEHNGKLAVLGKLKMQIKVFNGPFPL
jgi:dsRNA-specific ribonuclease